jgi:hypothetical protein
MNMININKFNIELCAKSTMINYFEYNDMITQYYNNKFISKKHIYKYYNNFQKLYIYNLINGFNEYLCRHNDDITYLEYVNEVYGLLQKTAPLFNLKNVKVSTHFKTYKKMLHLTHTNDKHNEIIDTISYNKNNIKTLIDSVNEHQEDVNELINKHQNTIILLLLIIKVLIIILFTK